MDFLKIGNSVLFCKIINFNMLECLESNTLYQKSYNILQPGEEVNFCYKPGYVTVQIYKKEERRYYVNDIINLNKKP